MHCSQVDMLAAIGSRFVVLDHVSDVEAFASLHAPLVQGYALDALEVPAVLEPATPRSTTHATSSRCCSPGTPVRDANVGMGETLRFAFGGLTGTALAVDDELATLTAFGHDDDGAAGSAHRSAIRTPVRRVSPLAMTRPGG